MAIVRKNLVLNFTTEDGSKLQIKVLKPKAGLAPEQIKAAMQTVLDEGAVGEASTISSIAGAQYDIRDIEEIIID